MNIQQLEYLIAIDNYRHFAKAAEACNVTQPTLSMMVQKLEEELDVKLFDRSTHPVEPTAIGRQVIDQARISLKYVKQIKEIVESEQNTSKGSFHLGIIPTIAPYVIPELLYRQNSNYKDIELVLKENPTYQIIANLQNGTLDGGLMAGPLNHPKLVEYPIYYEKFYAYVSPNDKLHKKKEVDMDKIDINNVWLLENVHCFRGQIERLCQKKRHSGENARPIRYEAGNIDTLINIVDLNQGLTVIPEMFAMGLSEDRQENLRPFKGLTAVREVSLVVSGEYVRKTMLNTITEIIKESVPKSMQNPALKKYIVDL